MRLGTRGLNPNFFNILGQNLGKWYKCVTCTIASCRAEANFCSFRLQKDHKFKARARTMKKYGHGPEVQARALGYGHGHEVQPST